MYKGYLDNNKQKELCCGCSACYDICSQNAILMTGDVEGFLYPNLDKNLCINCGLCRKVCIFHSSKATQPPIYDLTYQVPLAYGMKNINEEIRCDSRSGGVFPSLASYIIAKGGVVYGCILEKGFKVVHAKGTNENECNRFRKSKYCQSDMRNIYLSIIEELKMNQIVLFSGTSCQTAAVRSYLHVKLGNIPKSFYCVDILCHGVPSPLLWEKYIEYLEDKYKGKIEYFEFRNKMKYGWKSHVETFTINNFEYSSEDFGKLFINNRFLRPSCYECTYKTDNHPSDITLGDFWSVDKALPGFNDNRGISLVLINSRKGKYLFNQIRESFEYKQAIFVDCRQRIFSESVRCPTDRDKYWKTFKEDGILQVIIRQNRDIKLRDRKKKIKKILSLQSW